MLPRQLTESRPDKPAQVNTHIFSFVTGKPMPSTPVSAKSYADAGLPWFEIYDDKVPTVAPCPKLAAVQPVQAMLSTNGEVVEAPVERDIHPRRVSPGDWSEEVVLAQPVAQHDKDGSDAAAEVAAVIEAAWADVEPHVVISFNLPRVLAAQRHYHFDPADAPAASDATDGAGVRRRRARNSVAAAEESLLGNGNEEAVSAWQTAFAWVAAKWAACVGRND